MEACFSSFLCEYVGAFVHVIVLAYALLCVCAFVGLVLARALVRVLVHARMRTCTRGIQASLLCARTRLLSVILDSHADDFERQKRQSWLSSCASFEPDRLGVLPAGLSLCTSSGMASVRGCF